MARFKAFVSPAKEKHPFDFVILIYIYNINIKFISAALLLGKLTHSCCLFAWKFEYARRQHNAAPVSCRRVIKIFCFFPAILSWCWCYCASPLMCVLWEKKALQFEQAERVRSAKLDLFKCTQNNQAPEQNVTVRLYWGLNRRSQNGIMQKRSYQI